MLRVRFWLARCPPPASRGWCRWLRMARRTLDERPCSSEPSRRLQHAHTSLGHQCCADSEAIDTQAGRQGRTARVIAACTSGHTRRSCNTRRTPKLHAPVFAPALVSVSHLRPHECPHLHPTTTVARRARRRARVRRRRSACSSAASSPLWRRRCASQSTWSSRVGCVAAL